MGGGGHLATQIFPCEACPLMFHQNSDTTAFYARHGGIAHNFAHLKTDQYTYSAVQVPLADEAKPLGDFSLLFTKFPKGLTSTVTRCRRFHLIFFVQCHTPRNSCSKFGCMSHHFDAKFGCMSHYKMPKKGWMFHHKMQNLVEYPPSDANQRRGVIWDFCYFHSMPKLGFNTKSQVLYNRACTLEIHQKYHLDSTQCPSRGQCKALPQGFVLQSFFGEMQANSEQHGLVLLTLAPLVFVPYCFCMYVVCVVCIHCSLCVKSNPQNCFHRPPHHFSSRQHKQSPNQTLAFRQKKKKKKHPRQLQVSETITFTVDMYGTQKFPDNLCIFHTEHENWQFFKTHKETTEVQISTHAKQASRFATVLTKPNIYMN